MRKITAIIMWVLTMATMAAGQNFNLSKFTNTSGLPQNYVYSIVQDGNGYIWIGMAEGLSRYDGLRFTNYSTRDSLADNYVSKMIIDTDGNLWCGHGNGAFTVYNGTKFSKLPHHEEMTAPIKDMCIDDRGNIWAVEQNMGIVKISPDRKIKTYFDEEKFGGRLYSSICAINSMALLVGTSDGLLSIRVDADGTLHDPVEVEEIPSTMVNCIRPTRHGNAFWVCQDDGGVYRYSPANGSKRVTQCSESCTQASDTDYDIRSIYEDEEGSLYIATWGKGLHKWKYRATKDDYLEDITLNEDNGLDNNFVADIAVDREGVYWFATYGGGVVAWINNYFAQYDLTNIGFVRSKVTAARVRDGRLWLGISDGVIDMDVTCMNNFEYYDTSMGLPKGVEYTSIIFDEETGTQYLGTKGSGIYTKRRGERRYSQMRVGTDQHSQDIINGMVIGERTMYIATQGGLVTYDLGSGKSKVYTTQDGLPHNNINFVKIDNDGQLWLGPKDSGIAMLTQEDGFDIHRLANIPVDVADMAVDDRGRFWLATVSNGVLCTSNDSVVPITAADGLEKNYCYGIEADKNSHIWVCHQPGLSCIDLNNGNIRTYNVSHGINQEFYGIAADGDGDLWFAASTGVIHYMGEYDKRNSTAPIMNLTSVSISGRRHDINEAIDLNYPYDGNVAKLEFDFVGVCLKDPTNVNYEYWLQIDDGNDEEHWTALGTQTHKEFDFLPEGDYTLHIRAFNSDGIVSQRPLDIKIHIDKPFWKTWWFPIVAIIALTLGVRWIINFRERRLRHRQMLLEREVDRQTKELKEQKAEIERKNRDIEDSINYSNRIQTAILPSQNGLSEFDFADSFILYLPRDIVSGDFYWFDKYDNHVMICCGDCTGHGVPGAFLTMIGTTILNDAFRDSENRSPAKLLYKLDNDLKNTLNKNQSVEARDGMDCCIIDINMDTYEVVSAAAKRPVHYFIKGKLTTVKGTRRAIGDKRNDNEFVETRTQLNKGDYIYMTSDGYTDQIGGESTDEVTYKYGTSHLTKHLEEIINREMREQKKELQEELERWRGDYERVDDVIVMGIKL